MPTIREVIESKGFREGLRVSGPILAEYIKGWWLRRKARKAIKRLEKAERKKK